MPTPRFLLFVTLFIATCLNDEVSPSCAIVDTQVVRDPDICYESCKKLTGQALCKHLGLEKCPDTDEGILSLAPKMNGTVCERKCTPAPKRYVDVITCCPGYKNSSVTGQCEAIKACEEGGKRCQGTCVDTAGSFTCQCPHGFVLGEDGFSCKDHDECSAGGGDSLCKAGICVNTQGSYECTCPFGRKLEDDGHTCSDVDECTSANAGCAEQCVNTDGSFYCTCGLGYSLSSDGKTCDDINECLASNPRNSPCAALCVNQVGSYHCDCPPAFHLAPDGINCLASEVNGNEFPAEFTLDQQSALLAVKAGDFNDHCLDGFKLSIDGFHCEDVDECEDIAICSHACQNTNGSFHCICPDFLVISPKDNSTCIYFFNTPTNQALAGVFIGLIAVFVVAIVIRIIHQHLSSKRRNFSSYDVASSSDNDDSARPLENFIVCNRLSRKPYDVDKRSFGYHLSIPSIDED